MSYQQNRVQNRQRKTERREIDSKESAELTERGRTKLKEKLLQEFIKKMKAQTDAYIAEEATVKSHITERNVVKPRLLE